MRLHHRSLGFIILFGALSALPPLSIDMGLPGFSGLAKSLQVPIAEAALTLSFFLAGFSFAQLIFGPIADAHGRRPVLLGGCILFTVSGFMCGFAHSMQSVLLWRFLQGAGASVGGMIGMAMVRDLYEGNEARQKLSAISMVNSIAPAIAPTIGGLILLIGTWRTIYHALGLCGLILTLAVLMGIDETLKQHFKRSLHWREIASGYQRVITNRHCVSYSLISCFAFGSLFAYVSGSSVVLMTQLGVSTTMFGLLFAMTAVGIMMGSLLNANLNRAGFNPHHLLIMSLTLAFASAIAVFILSFTHYFQLIIVMPFLILGTFSYGLIAPNANYAALHTLPEVAGMASAFLGFLRIIGGIIASAMIALFYGHHAIAMTSIMVMFSSLAFLTYIFVSPREKI